MPDWNQHSVHQHMRVYSADNQDVGHIAEIYEDSFLIHKGFFFFLLTVTFRTALSPLSKTTV